MQSKKIRIFLTDLISREQTPASMSPLFEYKIFYVRIFNSISVNLFSISITCLPSMTTMTRTFGTIRT